ncbi:P-loop NTPase family protein [Novacetimonas pomaceti]|uniref:hypothetical protein n=1 Tax=Novacetimonas pomaceti TaxID=2021998 RepID=UPI001C2D1E59|nr:hypothetical protein [Novacetimonas pomaceti]MBV1833837.1 hypothetical protein [Novacetimonas pomaceti]
MHEPARHDDGRIALELCARDTAPVADANAVLVTVGQDMGDIDAHAKWGAVVPFTPLPAPFSHGGGCACCTGRGQGLAALLGDLFRRRATGGLPWFGRVVVMADAARLSALRREMTADLVVRARYRMENEKD